MRNIFVLIFLMIGSSCEILADVNKNDVKPKNLSYENIPGYIESGDQYIIRCRLTKSGNAKASAYRIHEIDNPKKGGLYWENAPEEKLNEIIAKAKGRSIIVTIKCTFHPNRSNFQRKPGRDPFGKIKVFTLIGSEFEKWIELEDPAGHHK